MLQQVIDAVDQYENVSQAANSLGIGYTTFQSRYLTAKTEGFIPSYLSKGMNIPKGIQSEYNILNISGPKTILIINDVHVPYHDERSLELAFEYAKEKGCDGIFINGDFMDFVSVSDHEKTPSERDGFHEELEKGREVLKAIVEEFPDADIWYNEGNHETRLPRYLMKKAPELFNIPGLSCRELLKTDMYGITWIPTETDVRMGDLNVFHGHEYRGGGLLVARSKFLQAIENIIFAHFHRTQEYIQPTIQGKVLGSWAVGCSCDLRPRYLPKNNWNHGFALVHLREDDHFVIENRKIIEGQIY